jgi:ankyrin repeat protein/predicted GIY-YIG superfamily endonuclease
VITTTLNDLLEGKLAGHDMAEYWLYVVRDVEENMTLYVGQSQHPVKRLFNHLKTSTPLGSLISEYESEARRWQVMLLTFEDCLQWESVRKCIATQRISWVDAAERELISFHHPCLNITHNLQPAPLPAKYTRSRRDLEQLGIELIEVTKGDHPAFVQVLWQALLAGTGNINAQDKDGKTALMWAALDGCPNIVRVLLAKGAAVDVKDKDGKTALIWAEDKGRTEIIQLLKQARILNRPMEDWGKGMDSHTDVKVEPEDVSKMLVQAAAKGHTDVVRAMLDRGADVKSSTGGRALRVAAFGGHLATVELLLNRGADVNARDNEGRTALSLAARRDATATVKLLLARGADINATKVKS